MNRATDMNLTQEELDVIYSALRAKQNTLDKLQKWAENNEMNAMADVAFEQRKIVATLLIKLQQARK